MNQRRKFIGTALTATAAGLFTAKATAQNLISPSATATIKPKRLKKGDTIGLIAPGYAISTDSLEKGKKALKEMGFVPYHTDRIIGNYGYFETMAHDVSGRAEIIDNCTIKVTEFYYDGKGPQVNFYVAQDHDYVSEDAFAISREINGPFYENAEFTLRLPNGKTLDDFNTLSVWCVEFGASFGELVFTQ